MADENRTTTSQNLSATQDHNRFKEKFEILVKERSKNARNKNVTARRNRNQRTSNNSGVGDPLDPMTFHESKKGSLNTSNSNQNALAEIAEDYTPTNLNYQDDLDYLENQTQVQSNFMPAPRLESNSKDIGHMQKRAPQMVQPLDLDHLSHLSKRERMGKLTKFTTIAGDDIKLDDVARDNLGLLDNKFYKNYINQIEGNQDTYHIFTDTAYLINSKQKKIRVILLITEHYLSVFQGSFYQKFWSKIIVRE